MFDYVILLHKSIDSRVNYNGNHRSTKEAIG